MGELAQPECCESSPMSKASTQVQPHRACWERVLGVHVFFGTGAGNSAIPVNKYLSVS